MEIKNQETMGFKSEVKELLHLMTHSLYSNKEIFLRELVSNASDAMDKLRFLALSKPDLYENDSNLRIRIFCDKNNRTITIEDNGIGMTKKEVIENIGTIAKSGTKSFFKKINKKEIKDNQFIGQFGVGFYSAFIVSEKVSLYTRAAGMNKEEGVFWESNGEGNFNIAQILMKNRGTRINLLLRKEEEEFLENWKLQNIVKKYSNHISFPIEMKFPDKEKKEQNYFWKKVNVASSLWTKKKSEISESEYKEFYKNIFHDFRDPLIWSHNQVEGKQEHISLLYIPEKLHLDLWKTQKNGLKLYVQRVFVMDNFEQLIPNYLRFIKGLIDSNDLPLNLSREMLQENQIIKNLRKSITKRSIKMIEKLSRNNIDLYKRFWKEYGSILKEGLSEDPKNSKFISNLLRFASTKNNSDEQNVSLKDYINRMIHGQKKIYYITSDNYSSARNNPHLDFFRKNDIEVLLLSDRIDEWMMHYLTEFENKSFHPANRLDSFLEKLIKKEENLVQEKENEKISEKFIENIASYLGDRVKKVCLTNKLISTPAVITTDKDCITTQMSKLLTSIGQDSPKIDYIFEINSKNEIIKHIQKIDNKYIMEQWIELIFNQALLIEKGSLEDPSQFVHTINDLLIKNIT